MIGVGDESLRDLRQDHALARRRHELLRLRESEAAETRTEAGADEVKTERQAKWDDRYMSLAREVATWSKDPSTKVGAVLVRANNSIGSSGFNGFPPGTDDDPALYADRIYKLAHVIHAEVNALEFADRETRRGSTIYTSFHICPSCLRRSIAEGVVRFVCPELRTANRPRAWILEWEERVEESKQIARVMGVELVHV